jgi:hypothetical protein
MRFSTAILAVLPVLALAAPLDTRASNGNALSNGLNKAADIANKEVADTQNAQAAIKNNQSPAKAEASLQTHLNQGVNQRVQNQGLAKNNKRANTKVTNTLSQIATKQSSAQSTINGFTGGKADASALAALQASFQGGNSKLSGAIGSVSIHHINPRHTTDLANNSSILLGSQLRPLELYG